MVTFVSLAKEEENWDCEIIKRILGPQHFDFRVKDSVFVSANFRKILLSKNNFQHHFHPFVVCPCFSGMMEYIMNVIEY